MNEMRFLDWAVASRTMPGEVSSGDISVVERVRDGAVLAVIDGLGHGVEAAKAAAAAETKVRECAGEPLPVILDHCHQALRGTRGAVMTLVHINEHNDTLTWLGVGNVEGRMWSAVPGDTLVRQAPPLRGGVVGHHMPKVHSSTLPLTRGDLIVLSTDGIKNHFHEEFRLGGTVKQIADHIVTDYWAEMDDALVLAARYLGSA